jgi:hypothetical protein
MDTLVETRWTRYGHDRVYVSTCEGLKVGHVDLKTGSIGVEVPGFSAALDDCKRRWFVGSPVPPPPVAATSPVSLPPPAPIATSSPAPRTEPEMAVPMPPPPFPAIEPMVPARDLAANAPGAAAKAKRDEVNASAPVLNFVARVFGVKTDERNWRVGAVGEQKVGRELAKLGPHWRVLHAVGVGNRGADIDHFVIGPAGMFTLNTKRHPDGKAWVAERAVMVNRQKNTYLRNSRHEGERASRLLTSACGFEVSVVPVVVFVDLATFEVKQQPPDVHVTTRKRLIPWLESLPIVIDSATIESVFDKARLSTTWAPHSNDDMSPEGKRS